MASRPLSIGEVSLHACIRMHKQAWCLIERGHYVHLLSNFIAGSHSSNTYTTVHQFDASANDDGTINSRQLRNLVKLMDPHVDVWHVHNEPNWMFPAVKEESKKPVIFDIHDWTSLRVTAEPFPGELEAERYALQYADGLICCSRGYEARARQYGHPTTTIYSMVPEFLFPEQMPKRPGLTYSGGLMGKSQIADLNYKHRHWASWLKEAVGLLPEGWKVYGYTANGGEDYAEYKDEKIVLHEPLVYPQLLKELSAHSVGLVGSPFECQDFTDSMPNKLFEYVAAGLPVVVVNAPEATKYAEENGLGRGIRDVSELPRALEGLTDHTISRDRWGFTMESQIPKLVAFYWEVLGVPKMFSQLGYGEWVNTQTP